MVLYVSCSNSGLGAEKPTAHCRVYRHQCRCFPTMIPVDYSRPLEAVIPGTAGKVLGVLARTHAELPIRRVAQLGGVSRDRASIEIRRLVVLGIVSRREVAGASLVKLERMNAATLALLALADARSTAISRLSELAKSIEPAPASLALFGSFARGHDDAESDLDVLAVRSDNVEPDDPSWLDSFGNWHDLARVVVGNPVNVIEISRHELPTLARTRSLWRTIVDDAITLAGEAPSQIVAPVGDRVVTRFPGCGALVGRPGPGPQASGAHRQANRAGSGRTSTSSGDLRASSGDAGRAESDGVSAQADKGRSVTARRARTTRELSPSEAPKYLSKAREFFEAAQFSLGLGNYTAATSNAIHAGMNAGDAISCALVGSVSKGEHADAPEHLKTIGDVQGARCLRQLLPLKTPAEYDPAPVSAAQARKAVEAAKRLIEHAEEKLNAALPR